jgi:hypothetical protein
MKIQKIKFYLINNVTFFIESLTLSKRLGLL